MNCYICEKSKPSNFFYCKACKKTEICFNCWKTWLNQSFTCPFDKTDEFLLEITQYNANLILEENYTFEPLPEMPYTYPVSLFNHQTIRLTTILDHFIPFYEETFVKDNFHYYFHLQSFFDMQIIKNTYEKWVLHLILSQITLGTFLINIHDMKYFGGLNFICFLNKHFENKIVINSEPTMITYFSKLWCPKTSLPIQIQTNLMEYLYLILDLEMVNLKERLRTYEPLETTYPDYDLINIFRIYFYFKFNDNKQLDDAYLFTKNKYFKKYFFSINNKFYAN